MHESDSGLDGLLRSIALAGNIFLLATLPELRRQGLTYLAFFVLQRVIWESEMSEQRIRLVTGLKDYEVSRACRFLAKSGLVTMEKGKADARNRMLTPTPKGLKIRNKVLLVAARRMRGTHWAAGSLRQLEEATEMFRVANRLLLGPLQLSLYEENRR